MGAGQSIVEVGYVLINYFEFSLLSYFFFFFRFVSKELLDPHLRSRHHNSFGSGFFFSKSQNFVPSDIFFFFHPYPQDTCLFL